MHCPASLPACRWQLCTQYALNVCLCHTAAPCCTCPDGGRCYYIWLGSGGMAGILSDEGNEYGRWFRIGSMLASREAQMLGSTHARPSEVLLRRFRGRLSPTLTSIVCALCAGSRRNSASSTVGSTRRWQKHPRSPRGVPRPLTAPRWSAEEVSVASPSVGSVA